MRVRLVLFCAHACRVKDAAGKDRFKRLDLSKGATRDKITHATTPEELNHLFDTDGYFA